MAVASCSTTQGSASTPARRLLLADAVGVCFGVKRAIAAAERARAERAGRIVVLGPLVHNPQVIDRLADAGIEAAYNVAETAGATVVLSAHGVSPAVRSAARELGVSVVDATCPFVTRVHRAAVELHRMGYQVLLVGDAGHTEVEGVLGAVEAAGGRAIVVSSVDDLRDLPLRRKVGLVCQTTQRTSQFAAIAAELCRRCVDVRAVNTVCGATDTLQDAAIRLAREVEVVVVVGGRNSANSRRLRDICDEQGAIAHQVETADEIDDAWLEGKTAIGVTAGASTPDWLIEEVGRRLNYGDVPDGWKISHPGEEG